MPCRAWGSHRQLWDRQRQVAEVRCPISYALSPATLETVSNAWSMAWKAFTELAEGVVVVIDRARPGWRLSPGWRLFFLAPSFLGKLFRAAADRRRGPPWVAEEQEGKDLAPQAQSIHQGERCADSCYRWIGHRHRLAVGAGGNPPETCLTLSKARRLRRLAMRSGFRRSR
jgi:hypothetical protein